MVTNLPVKMMLNKRENYALENTAQGITEICRGIPFFARWIQKCDHIQKKALHTLAGLFFNR
jgi:hypothetical protein